MISIKNTGHLRIKKFSFVFLHSINHLVQHFKNNDNLTEKILFNLPAHLIVFENIKQYF